MALVQRCAANRWQDAAVRISSCRIQCRSVILRGCGHRCVGAHFGFTLDRQRASPTALRSLTSNQLLIGAIVGHRTSRCFSLG